MCPWNNGTLQGRILPDEWNKASIFVFAKLGIELNDKKIFIYFYYIRSYCISTKRMYESCFKDDPFPVPQLHLHHF